MNVLELFSGTGSVGKCCKELGYDVVSVDLLLPADHQIDIMNFNYRQYPKDYFDIVWASPPCVEYSVLKTSHIGRKMKNGEIFTREKMNENMDNSDKLVLKTLEIINYFNPPLWFIENPQGRLRTREIMKGIPYYTIDYCMYSNWGYRKRTNIWTNKKDFTPLTCNGKCGNMIGNKHSLNLGGLNKHEGGNQANIPSQHEKYRIPPELIYSLFLIN